MIAAFPVVTRSLLQRVLAILASELPLAGDPLNVNVPIGDLGADSLSALSLQYEIEEAIGIAFLDGEDFTPDLTAIQIYDRVAAKVGAA
ncbi:acyl carrier protein [Collimonas pratensis]|uniref:Phosphopantetheine attachment site family protein n=1 Tax=Collimonas pratensis TaxID=279113 RepID=A0ABM5Z8T6_9BURK|nr:acyl carrier protein [Collimonas pratensis]AMP15517.1 phosphopantetheine attachment site family protein [Collimonas pratensis]